MLTKRHKILVGGISLVVVAEIASWFASLSQVFPSYVEQSAQNPAYYKCTINGSIIWCETINIFIWFGDHTSIIATVLIAVFTGTLWWSTRRLWIAGEKQIAATQRMLVASHRAWIRVDLQAGNILTFGAQGAQTLVSIQVENIGNAPAINISPHIKLFVSTRGQRIPVQEHWKFCEDARKTPTMIGQTLFPNEKYPEKMGIASYGITALPQEISDALAKTIDDDKDAVFLYVAGCVDYTFPSDPDGHHQTGFFYDLRRSKGAIRVTETAPITDLVLLDTVIGIGRHAD
ncbi:MAG TPA: hypothetical protein VEU53_07840 [Stellaceae bacterium]|nr:hypothetical protein [Stellaceae bacterium]